MNEQVEKTNPDLELVDKWRSDTKRDWSGDDKVAAWRKYGRANRVAQWDATRALLDAARICPGLRVLDVAGGAGDPSLAAARAVGPTGHVDVTDVSEGMLETARLFAGEDGLTNITWQVADAEDLPYPDESYDRALCRCGVMFFADHRRALQEIRRVLKPGGRAAFLAWGPYEEIPLFNSLMDPLREVLPSPPPPPGTPSPFKFSEAGSLAAALREAGFSEVREEALTSIYRYTGGPADFLQQVLEMSGTHAALAELAEAQRASVLKEAEARYGMYSDGRTLSMPLAYVLATGIR